MMNRRAAMGIFALVFTLYSGITFAQAVSPGIFKDKSQADDLEDKSAQAMDDGNTAQGMDLMARSVQLDPSPIRHMIYGSMLYGNGVTIFKAGDKAQGIEVLRHAESELIKAIQGFNPNTEQSNLSQCYFLLGEIYRNAFNDRARARGYYEQAVELNDYPGAKDALNQISS